MIKTGFYGLGFGLGKDLGQGVSCGAWVQGVDEGSHKDRSTRVCACV